MQLAVRDRLRLDAAVRSCGTSLVWGFVGFVAVYLFVLFSLLLLGVFNLVLLANCFLFC